MTNSNPPGREPWSRKPGGDGEDTPVGDAEPSLGKAETPDAPETAADKIAEETGYGGGETPDITPAEPMPAEAESEAAVEATDSLRSTEKLDYEPASPELGEAEARDRAEMGADIEPAAVTPEPEPEPAQKKGGGAFLWVIAVLLALGVGGYFTWSSWSPRIAQYIPDSIRAQSWFPAIPGEAPETAAVEAPELAPEEPVTEEAATEPAVTEDTETESPAEEAAEVEVVDVTGAPADGNGAAAPAAVAALTATVQNATQRLDGMQDAIAAARQELSGLATQVAEQTAALRDRLGGLEARTKEIEQSTVTVLAINSLAAAAESGDDFSSQLTTVKNLVGGDADVAAAIAELEANAGGVATLASLKRAFPEVGDAIVRTNAGREDGDWVDRLVGRLQGLYTFRAPGEGDPAAEGVAGAVARAERALGDNDLATAVSELQGIEGPEAAREWLSAAQGRLAVDDSIARVRETALARLTSKTGS